MGAKGIKELVEELKGSVIREECRTCECFQGFIAQLEMDFENILPDADLHDMKVEPEKMHCCLGCSPCPPADVYSRYLAPHDEAED